MMLIGMAAILFLLGLGGASFSFWIIGKKKKANRQIGAAVVACVTFCLMAALSAFYLASAMLLLGGVD